MKERTWRELFDIGILLKGIDGTLELLGGAALIFISPAALNAITFFFLGGELKEDPKDFIANLFLHTAQTIIRTQTFAGAILVVHGAVKIFLAGALMRNRRWAYPVAIALFTAFVIYQSWQWAFNPSLFLGVITVIDIAVIGLIIHEYWYIKKHERSGREE